MSAPLVDLIVNQNCNNTGLSLVELLCGQNIIMTIHQKEKHVKLESQSNVILDQLSPSLKYAVSLVQEHEA